MTVSYAKTNTQPNLRTLVSSSCFEGDVAIRWGQSRRHSVKYEVIRKEIRALVSATIVFTFLLSLSSAGYFRDRYHSNAAYGFSLWKSHLNKNVSVPI